MPPSAEFTSEAARTERLIRELHMLAAQEGITLVLSSSGYINAFFVVIKISRGPYMGCNLKLLVDLPFRWPQLPPKFICGYREIFHPNISSDGRVCLNLLRDDYEPSHTLLSLVLALVCLIEDPNTENPFNLEAAKALERGEWQSNVLTRLQAYRERCSNTSLSQDEQPASRA